MTIDTTVFAQHFWSISRLESPARCLRGGCREDVISTHVSRMPLKSLRGVSSMGRRDPSCPDFGVIGWALQLSQR